MPLNPIFRDGAISENFNLLYQYLAVRSNWLTEERARLALIDREVERENDRDPEQEALVRLNAAGDKRRMRGATVPVIKPAYLSARAHMDSVFLDGYPIYSVVAPREQEDVGAAMHALIARDQDYYDWERQLRIAMADGLRYNCAAVEARWTTEMVSTIATQLTEGSATTGVATEVAYSGNRLRRLDPYNLFYDRSIAPGDVARYGDFVGYVEAMTYGQVKAHLQSLDNDFKNTKVLAEMLRSGVAGSAMSATPAAAAHVIQAVCPIIRNIPRTKDSQDFSSFFAQTTEGAAKFANSAYTRVAAYVRIIPRDFGIIGPAQGRVAIYEVQWINGYCIYVRPLAEGHGRFPIAVAAPHEDGIPGQQQKSFCEDLVEFQDVATAMQRARAASLRRLLEDRALFDSQRIRESDINSSNPSAKIPVRVNGLNRDLGSAYMQIPYRDEYGQTFNIEMQQQIGLAQAASGVNPAMSGQFVKGNKTYGEFERVMSGGDAKLQLIAKAYESQLHAPIKYIIRSNYLQFAVSEDITDRKTGKITTVDPARLRETQVNFTMVDGALPASKVMNPDVLNTAVTGLTQLAMNTGTPMTHDVMAMFISMLRSAGFHNLDDYKLSPQQQQQEQQQQELPAGDAPQ
jgi:hypothetical protein